MRRIVMVLLILLAGLPAVPNPARAELALASVDALRPVFRSLLGDPAYMTLEAVPDLYAGGYAQISIYARHVAGSAGRDEGLRLARELLLALLDRIDGAYFMPSFGRYEVVAALVREVRARIGRVRA